MKGFHIYKRFNNISISKKLLLSYVLVVLLPVLLIGLILTYRMKEMVIERSINEASVNVERIYTRLNDVLKLVIDVSDRSQLDQNLENLLLKKYNSTWEVVDAYFQYREFNNYITYFNREINDIKLYSFNETMLDGGPLIKVTSAISNLYWFQQAVKENGRINFHYIYDQEAKEERLCLVRMIRGIGTTQKPLGIIVISLKQDYLNSIFKNEPYETLMVSDTGKIIAAKNTGLAGNQADTGVFSDLVETDSGVYDSSSGGHHSKVIIKSFLPMKSNNAFKIVSIVPVKQIEEQADETMQLGVAIMAASLLLALGLILVFSNAISKRVKNISRDMHKVAMGNFDFIPRIEGEDEIGQLSSDLGIMVKSIKDLVHEVYEVNLQKNRLAVRQREIKLKMLASQINPHFLFNALETIRMKAHCRGEEEIAEVVKLLGRILRRNLEVGSEMASLESEIDMVKSYLEVQKFRYGDRINYEITFEENVKDYKIMPLLIQPIVENAIVHGLESKNSMGMVKINLTREDGRLKIIVEDNGGGMDAGQLNHVLETLKEAEDMPGERIGLKNVHQRIKLSCGEEYGLLIHSEKGLGTRIAIILPEEW